MDLEIYIPSSPCLDLPSTGEHTEPGELGG